MRSPVFDRRRAGVLLPLFALEAPLGRGGRAFIDWLAAGGFSLWQILPVGPTGADGSPYWVRSDRAGNPQLLDAGELPDPQAPIPAEFRAGTADWLPDYALFEALARVHGGAPFWRWPAPLRDRAPAALEDARRGLGAELARIEREQYAFHVQWERLREYARARDVRLFGDLPFYVGPSSAETWVHRTLFQLAPSGAPAVVGGVPPDYFSELGQLWGNPAYEWQAHRSQDFSWWLGRLRAQLTRMDLLRLDHFRGLAAYWAVPAGAADARGGLWHSSPGAQLLERLRADCGGALPLVAEDLGMITADVLALKNDFGLPGMRVLQFAFGGGADNPHLPYLYERACVVYTGTHDNDTTRGWYSRLDPDGAERVRLYLGCTAADVPEAMVRTALGSVALLAVISVQDILGLGSEARINTPGTTVGNWAWRLPPGALTRDLASSCARLNRLFGRSG